MLRLTMVAALSALLSAGASALTYSVRPDGGGDYPTIRAAVMAAADGDTVLLEDGVFSGPGNHDIDYLGKAITIAGRSRDWADCTIDCEGRYRGFIFESGEGPGSVLRDVTVIQGSASAGPAVRCVSGSSPAITHCAFRWNHATSQGGALYCSESCPTITACLFSENSSDQFAGAALCNYCDMTRFVGCVFEDNVAEWEAGALASMGEAHVDTMIVKDCVFSKNRADRGGGFMSSTADVIKDCIFEYNQAMSFQGGGLMIHTNSEPQVTDCTFYRNSAAGVGGAIWCSSNYECYPRLTGCTLLENEAAAGSGLCVAGAPGWPLVDNCVMAFGGGGAAVYTEGPTPVLSCCDLYGNEGGDWVGCVASQFGVRNNFHEDPLFCAGMNPSRPYSLRPASPCAAENSPECGQVGAWGIGCGTPQETGEPEGRQAAPALRAEPNPFCSSTRIDLVLARTRVAGRAWLTIHDVAGRLVRALSVDLGTDGRGSVVWDGASASGRPLGPGVYFVRPVGVDSAPYRLSLLR